MIWSFSAALRPGLPAGGIAPSSTSDSARSASATASSYLSKLMSGGAPARLAPVTALLWQVVHRAQAVISEYLGVWTCVQSTLLAPLVQPLDRWIAPTRARIRGWIAMGSRVQ